MANCEKKGIDSKHGVDGDGNVFEPNSVLNTEKRHKDWYNSQTMGKQRGKPKYDMKEKKK
jgi:hypothetical protein